MAKQLNLLSGQVVTAALHIEMQQSYLEYAMSVIIGRALPDVRDGQKPVHRRILYAMHELGLAPDRPFRKCARVVGDVLGKYHPHGDQAVYDAMVRMIQDFSSRYPLIDGHGNFGSIDNDPAAAMRYTESRLASISNEGLLTQIGEAIVDYTNNFDGSQQEPTVLPAQLPFLLLNGSSGIAVGMATNVPPHNLGEVVDGLIALIDNPNLSDEKLFRLIPGPDFPTGGEIVSTDGIIDAYTKGRGSIPIRGVATIEEVPTARGRRTKRAIVVTELPYQVNKAGWIEKTADLVNAGKIEGISDLRDESDRSGIRVVIELKREADPSVVLHHLYQHTDLLSKFGAIMLALVDAQPRQLSLRDFLQEFISFREQTLTRRYSNDLEIAQGRCHIVEGLLKALTDLDTTIDILRNAPDGSSAKVSFQESLGLSENQADAILAMPMRRLTGLERQKLEEEYEQLRGKIQELQGLLSDRRLLLRSLKKELRTLKRKYGDPRRTRIIVQAESNASVSQQKSNVEIGSQETNKEAKGRGRKSKGTAVESQFLTLEAAPPPTEEVVIEFTHRGYVRRLLAKEFEKHQIDKKSNIIIENNDDFTINIIEATTDQTLVVLTRSGKAYPLKVNDIPSGSNRSTTRHEYKGVPLVTLLSLSATKEMTDARQEFIIAQFVLQEAEENKDLIMLTQNGKIKRLPLSDLSDITNRGITVIKLKEEDELRYANLAQVGEQVVLATSGGRLLRLEIDEEQLPLMGRTAQGSQATRLRKQEELVGCVTLDGESNLFLVSEQGYGKRIAIGSLRVANRGGIGQNAFQFTRQTDVLAGIVVSRSDVVAQMLTTEGKVCGMMVDSVKVYGQDDRGNRLVKLGAKERIIKVVGY
ncbi:MULTISPECIES: DNA gyrase/topoisomerase IV subunit A [Okeania]|uniref:DNA topoisomerase (ATP-hydrolyzing) n=1 Tax=Okeania hirsuta TaxID=1458930 RepID=A0A3N6PTH8_9CYAN|nr:MULTISPECIES: DNA topoisomerase (ATP-hydrolyzing) [Okeania]NES89661.1 DNA topoisomerase 4 subunit A [Okeania sp. SIO2B9]NET77377.1 DNA topoisomerase 4 subunit A [Okeania sp. SIO1F9]RQH18988.1 DNA topoisomerase 4 subunit A [Okeania hirsuta]RQH53543.1 DNA topoisomerase 4 subunit A [Okeania hirsuta]